MRLCPAFYCEFIKAWLCRENRRLATVAPMLPGGARCLPILPVPAHVAEFQENFQPSLPPRADFELPIGAKPSSRLHPGTIPAKSDSPRELPLLSDPFGIECRPPATSAHRVAGLPAVDQSRPVLNPNQTKPIVAPGFP